MEKLIILKNWLAKSPYDGVIITRRDNFSWVTNGNQNHVMDNTPLGVASLVIQENSITLVADSSDCLRMAEEENQLNAKPLQVPWYQPIDSFWEEYLSNGTFASDTGLAGTPNIHSQLVSLRMALTDTDIARYRVLGKDCAGILEDTCRAASPGATENEIALTIRKEAAKLAISPSCILVGSDSRISRYRHPMPTHKKTQDSLMVVMGGERHGLWVSVTRMVYFSPIPDDILRRHQKLQVLFGEMQYAMKDGLSYGDYFSIIKNLYAKAGYPNEWKNHHQGGPTGYACREHIATPKDTTHMSNGQAFAWNPTITGTKCEETTLLTPTGVENLTYTGRWPVQTISTLSGEFLVSEILQK